MKKHFGIELTVVALLLGASFIVAPVTACFAQGKVGVLDVRRALSETNAGKKAMKSLEGKYSKDMERKIQGIKAIEEKMSKRGKMMKPAEKTALQKDYNAKRISFNKLRGKIVQEEKAVSKKIVGEIFVLAKKIAKEEGFSLIIEKGANVVYSQDSLDITDKVISRHNSTYKGK